MTESIIGRKVTIKDSGSVKQWEIVAMTHDNRFILANDNGKVATPAVYPVERLELVPLGDAAGPKGYLGVGDFRCTQDEATEWFVFLMLQAAQLFTCIPEDSRDEVLRLLTTRGLSEDSPDVLGALAYYDAATKWYKENDFDLDEEAED